MGRPSYSPMSFRCPDPLPLFSTSKLSRRPKERHRFLATISISRSRAVSTRRSSSLPPHDKGFQFVIAQTQTQIQTQFSVTRALQCATRQIRKQARKNHKKRYALGSHRERAITGHIFPGAERRMILQPKKYFGVMLVFFPLPSRIHEKPRTQGPYFSCQFTSFAPVPGELRCRISYVVYVY